MEADQPIDVYVTPRCGICSFDLLEGDRVVIVDEDGRRRGEYPFVPWGCYRDSDKVPGVAYNALVLDNLYSGLPGGVGCHAECLAREPCTPPPARFFSTAYNYWPRPDEVRRRERWLRTCRVAPTLHRILRRRFAVPVEVCEVIAEHCSLREWAAAVASEFWERHSATPVPEHHEFNISSSVWARRVEFEGVSYISYLTNESAEETTTCSLVYSPQPDEEVDTLYIAEDYLGVSRPLFRFVRCDAGPPALSRRLVEKSIKLRFLGLRSPGRSSKASNDKQAFEQPIPRTQQLYWHDLFYTSHAMRMVSFVCNSPDTTAYSVCCDNRPYTIHAHRTGEQDLAYYAAEARPERFAAVWLYMPLWRDEKVAEIWTRRFDTDDHRRHAAFIIRTNQNRTFVLGPHPQELRYGNWVYTLIYRAGETPDRIYFDISLLGIHEIILGAPLPRVRVDLPLPQALPQLPSPRSACPSHYYYDENYYFTSATLDGVAEISPCRSDLGVIGLLLHYHDGRLAALGQVRLDKLQRPPLKIDPSRSMWLHFSVSSENCPNIEAIEFVPPTVVGPQHFPVAWRGTLEWWFSYRQCRLWHGQLLSPPTTPGKVLDYDD